MSVHDDSWNRLDSRHAGAGTAKVRAQQFRVIGEDAAHVAPARDADVKLFLTDGGQRTRRCDDQDFIHRLAFLNFIPRRRDQQRFCSNAFKYNLAAKS